MDSVQISQRPDAACAGASYQYQTLAYPDSIRLLELNPGELCDPIVCTLHPSRLNENHFYEAISYVWGDRSTMRHITCDFQRLDITVNLDDILRRLQWYKCDGAKSAIENGAD